MTQTCSSCGAKSSAEARFCRLCGSPFNLAGTGGKRSDDVPVSPLAETVPLVDEGRVTENIGINDAHQRAAETSRVSRAEMEEMLRRPHSEATTVERNFGKHSTATDAAPSNSPHTHGSAPLPTTALDAASLRSAATTGKLAAQSSNRRRPSLLVAALLVAAVGGGSLAWFYASRKQATDETSRSTQTNAASGQRESALDEYPAATKRNEQDSAAPPNAANPNDNRKSKETARDERENAARPAAHQAVVPAPSPSPVAASQTSTRTPLVKPPVSNVNRAAVNDPDSFYIKGLSVLNQREPKKLLRAEVVQALEYFQRAAQPGGAHRAEAQKYAERLGKELDKRRNVKQ